MPGTRQDTLRDSTQDTGHATDSDMRHARTCGEMGVHANTVQMSNVQVNTVQANTLTIGDQGGGGQNHGD